jgi:ABC-2 type transport system permease protein
MRSSLGRIGAIAVRIISQFRRDPRTIALIIMGPILVMSLLGYVITEKSTTVSIGVVDLDQGVPSLGPALDQLLGSKRLTFGPVVERLLGEKGLKLEPFAGKETLLAWLEEGRLGGGVVIPAEFSTGIMAGKGLGSMTLVVEGSDAMLSGDIARRFGQALQAFPQAAAEELKSLLLGLPAGVVGGGIVGLPVLAVPPGQPKVEYVYGGPELGTLSYFAPGYVAFFAFFFTFLLTSVSFLRERSSGTMERLLASPVKRSEIVIGYLLGFGLFAILQSLVILLFAVYALGVKIAGSLVAAFIVESALVGVAVVMGIFFSFYARTEFQVIQFIPLVIIPQIVLSGFMTPLETMWEPLRWLGMAMPMTYANNALRAVIIRGWSLGSVLGELAILVGFVLLFTVLASRLIKRRVA